jgi:hypothetical protein
MRSETIFRKGLWGLVLTLIIASWPLAALSAGNSSIDDHIIETETGVYYIVQPGDTLWDLSQRFSDSPWLWPDLWTENQEIPNPHLIYPGDRIKLYRRADRDTLGGALPVTPEGTQKTFTYVDIDAVGFIRKTALSPSGYILDVESPKNLISDYDVVYIRPQGHTFAPGQKFTIYRTLNPIRDNKTKTTIGIQHFLLGVAEVTEVTPDVAVAKITKSFRPIEPQDMVTPYIQRSATIPLQESVPGLLGKMISSEEHHKMIASEVTAFIDKGTSDGIEVGQRYTVFDQRTSRIIDGRYNQLIQLPRTDIGSLLVLHTEENTATVLVTRARKDIEPWTPVCSPF